ncbi:hypothetical protein RFI_36109 [Reticulomyxa filosa]|uniref:Uncharacterized protein n=1 Tax=Reticulomyxa filosa TaxID=46433 RepID=X6LIZ7_RETFI|nr:hypothetical protein RFI_36109 [Reticulomyxa filosa]|eukprot:ETO01331.1 hypothetical protein RFI_36109 [Reticulomyxa filosa]
MQEFPTTTVIQGQIVYLITMVMIANEFVNGSNDEIFLDDIKKASEDKERESDEDAEMNDDEYKDKDKDIKPNPDAQKAWW